MLNPKLKLKVEENDIVNFLPDEGMQSENKFLKLSLAALQNSHSAVEAGLGDYRQNLASWMDDCLEQYQDAFINVVPLPSRDYVIVVALKCAPYLNDTVVRVEA